MWKKIKELVLKKKQPVITNVIFNGVVHEDNEKIAGQFNDYFINSIKAIRNSIEEVQYVNNVAEVNKKFNFRAITISELKNIIKQMNSKPDYCKVTSKIITDNWGIVGNILLNIINNSLKTGKFPDSWKETVVTPIEKVNNTKKCEEFRPINSLKTCEKILEKVVKEQLENYMESNSLISKYQSGYRKKFSCETAVNFVINRWKNIEKKRKIMAIFLDFKRAFETIDRKIMIKKLYMYGIQGVELDWFKSYLTNRRQLTTVNGVRSKSIENEFGVPQGSILGALLFSIYINDMPNIVSKSEIILYADDTLIYTEGDTEEQCQNNMAHDINNINNWLKMNKLKLNEDKTKIIEINMTSNRSFKINDKIIEKVEQIKYLGFIIDKKLKFKEHIENICKKIGKKVGFFKRIRNKLSTITAINIYNTIIKPHFEFGSTIIYTCCKSTQLDRLQKLQNKAMRTILKCSRYTPILLMLNTLKWLNIKQRLELNTLIFIKKMKQGNAPEYLCEQIRYVGNVQPYRLRNTEDFRLQQATTTAMQASLFYKGLKLYNSLPNYVKNERNEHLFRKEYVNFVKNNVYFES